MIELMINQRRPEMRLVKQAAEVIKNGGLAIFPTDTVYGLGAALFNQKAIKRIFKLKSRSTRKGLVAMIADITETTRISSDISDSAKTLMTRFWPGPLTLIMPAAGSIPEPVAIGDTVGVRLPDNKLVRELVRAVGQPLATTSANISGRKSATSANEARTAAGWGDVFINGGKCAIGIESTVVDTKTWPPTVFREGAISKEALWQALRLA